jgi:hypothetical protein
VDESTRRIDELDTSLFDAVSSQTSPGDRRSLLAVQRAVARAHGQYAYLEIGSYYGGSIQPHLADARCTKIYSLDPRPAQQPDDRCSDRPFSYEPVSSERMLALLSDTGLGDVKRIECIESDASEVDLGRIAVAPRIAFIDGEHTKRAVASDFDFCSRVLSDDGVMLLHDFPVMATTILRLCARLAKRNPSCTSMRLEGSVFAVFLDGDTVASDSYLASLHMAWRRARLVVPAKAWLRERLPRPLFRLAKGARGRLHGGSPKSWV